MSNQAAVEFVHDIEIRSSPQPKRWQEFIDMGKGPRMAFFLSASGDIAKRIDGLAMCITAMVECGDDITCCNLTQHTIELMRRIAEGKTEPLTYINFQGAVQDRVVRMSVEDQKTLIKNPNVPYVNYKKETEQINLTTENDNFRINQVIGKNDKTGKFFIRSTAEQLQTIAHKEAIQKATASATSDTIPTKGVRKDIEVIVDKHCIIIHKLPACGVLVLTLARLRKYVELLEGKKGGKR
jgi:hypothetical protein